MVMNHESRWSVSCQKADLKSILENICAFCNFALYIFSYLEIGKLNDLIALWIFLVSKVILSEPSGFFDTAMELILTLSVLQ